MGSISLISTKINQKTGTVVQKFTERSMWTGKKHLTTVQHLGEGNKFRQQTGIDTIITADPNYMRPNKCYYSNGKMVIQASTKPEYKNAGILVRPWEGESYHSTDRVKAYMDAKAKGEPYTENRLWNDRIYGDTYLKIQK